MTHEDRCGKDSLIEIYSNGDTENYWQPVVRWCPNCGAVVVDTDYDGRTKPGDIEPMRFPALSKRVWELEDKYPPVKY